MALSSRMVGERSFAASKLAGVVTPGHRACLAGLRVHSRCRQRRRSCARSRCCRAPRPVRRGGSRCGVPCCTPSTAPSRRGRTRTAAAMRGRPPARGGRWRRWQPAAPGGRPADSPPSGGGGPLPPPGGALNRRWPSSGSRRRLFWGACVDCAAGAPKESNRDAGRLLVLWPAIHLPTGRRPYPACRRSAGTRGQSRHGACKC